MTFDANPVQSFSFSADRQSQILILGSMPGLESLKRQQYYAHPRNLFWEFMAEFFKISRQLTYEQRLLKLRQLHIALWDVAYSCQRIGSLDVNIKNVRANDFESLFKTAKHIKIIFFNGKKAASLFAKLVEPMLSFSLEQVILPSTSPANAAVSLADKRAAWQQIPWTLQRLE